MAVNDFIAIKERIHELRAAIRNQGRLERMKALEIQEHIKIQSRLYDEQIALELELDKRRKELTMTASDKAWDWFKARLK